MTIVRWEKQETVAVMRMCNGINPQNLAFAGAMKTTIENILTDSTISSIVLTSDDEKNFSQGVDLAWIVDRINANDTQAVKDFMYGMNDVFKAFLLSPVPTIAAINGHAFGNGAILACACDFRFMRKDRGYFCFPEIDVDVPFRPGIIDIAAKAVPKLLLQKMIYTGKRCTAEEMEKEGVIEKACENSEETIKAAIAFAKSFQKGRKIFYDNKKALNGTVLKRVHAERDSQKKMFQECQWAILKNGQPNKP